MADLLIRGMEMPKHCIDCPCMVDKYGGDNCCLQSEEANEKITSWDDMKAGCPLVELTPHGDLIDRDAFREDMTAWLNWCSKMWITPTEIDVWEKLMETLDIAPAIIPSNKEGSK